MKLAAIALVAALAGWAASIYWSPYQSCTRALYCARFLQAN